MEVFNTMKKIRNLLIIAAIFVVAGTATVFAAGNQDKATTETVDSTSSATERTRNGGNETSRKGQRGQRTAEEGTLMGKPSREAKELLSEDGTPIERPSKESKQRGICDGTNCVEENCFIDENGDGLCDNTEGCPCQKQSRRNKGSKGSNADQAAS